MPLKYFEDAIIMTVIITKYIFKCLESVSSLKKKTYWTDYNIRLEYILASISALW